MRKVKQRVLEDTEPEVDLDEDEFDDEEDEEEEEEEDELEEEDEEEEDDEEEDEEDEEEEEGEWNPPAQRPAFRRSRAFLHDDAEAEGLTEEMAAAIRAGIYVPKRVDPWTAHILYNALKDAGRL